MPDTRSPDFPRTAPWDDEHKHEWKEVESQFSNEYHAAVVCTVCNCPGDMDRHSGDVFWPAT